MHYIDTIDKKIKREGLDYKAFTLWDKYEKMQPSYDNVKCGRNILMREKEATVYNLCMEELEDIVKLET